MDDKYNVNRPYDAFFRSGGSGGPDGEEKRTDAVDGAGAANGAEDAAVGVNGTAYPAGVNGAAYPGGANGSADAGDRVPAASGGSAGAASGTPARPTYYYSYGPFRSGGADRGASSDTAIRSEAAASSERHDGVAQRPQVVRTWTVRERKRRSWLAPAAAFLAGIVLTGSLMFASDYLNLFTGSDQALAPSQSTGSGAGAGADAPAASTAAGSASGGTVSNAVDVVRPNNIAKIVEQSSPAVVKIETYVKTRSRSGNSLFDDPFFRQFFGDSYRIPSDEGDSQRLVPSGLGSGFFFDKDGYILTNQHVVGGADKITVTVIGYDEPLEAELLGSSYDLDLAVLKVKSDKAFPTLPLGDSDAIAVGEWVVAIGNPNGFDHTVTVGVLSAKERPITIQDTQGTRQYQHLLQTDASINPGNSGGPLINLAGEVIGINTAVSTTAQGIGFAIPTSTIVEVLDNLKENKPVPQPFIGAMLDDITEQAAEQLGLNSTKGSIVVNILYNSPAYKADLRQYDVIVGMDGQKYDTTQDLIRAIQNKKVGEKAVLDVIRGGNQVQITVEIGDKNDFNVQG